MITAILIALCAGIAEAPVHNSELIFPRNDKHNHASSIVETPQGDLLACWFHGTGERQADDVMVQGARKRKGADSWCEPFIMTDTPDLPDCNPVLYMDPRGVLWLFWVTIQDNQWGNALLKYRTALNYSEDGPPKWDWQDVIHCRPKNLEDTFINNIDKTIEKYNILVEILPGVKEEAAKAKEKAHDKLSQRLGWMTRIHPIMLSDNCMMLGLYSDVFNCSLATFTNDWGKTWEFSEPIMDLGNIQPSFVKKKDGTIAAFMRDNGIPHRIRYAESKDNGMTWSAVSNLEIENPGSSVECIPLRSGNWALVGNDTIDGRHLLTVYLSDDEGATWKWKRSLEKFEKNKGSGSYPSMIQTSDGMIHCTYSYTTSEPGSSIRHTWFNEEWVREGDK